MSVLRMFLEILFFIIIFDQGRHVSQDKKTNKKKTLRVDVFNGLWKILESVIVRPPAFIDVVESV